MQCGENLTKLLYFFNISSPLEVVWSHATNSKVKLERALGPGRYSMMNMRSHMWLSPSNERW